MSYVGDFRLGDTFDIKFTTVTTTGAPTTLAGTPVVSAYVGNSTTQITAGITLSVDFDSVTGLHNVRVVASGANGYATASNYQLVITTGTVGETSVVGYVIGQFSIENRSAVMPTTAARTLDVSAGGEAGIDWANVGSPTTSLALTGTTIATTQKVDIETIKTQTVTAAGAVTVGAFVGQATAAIGVNVSGHVSRVVLTDTVTTYTGNTVQTGDAFARLGAPAGASVSADIAVIEAQTDDIGVAGAGLTALASAADLTTLTAYVDTEVAAIKAKTDSLTFTVAAQLDVNVQYVNDVQVKGVGTAADPWNPV